MSVRIVFLSWTPSSATALMDTVARKREIERDRERKREREREHRFGTKTDSNERNADNYERRREQAQQCPKYQLHAKQAMGSCSVGGERLSGGGEDVLCAFGVVPRLPNSRVNINTVPAHG